MLDESRKCVAFANYLDCLAPGGLALGETKKGLHDQILRLAQSEGSEKLRL